MEPVRKLFSAVKNESVLDQMLYIDTKTWLPDDLLIKADKMTMANSLELRVPLLDHRLLEFAASLPPHYKLKGFTMKYIWKKALSKRVPDAILKRKKAGFPVPYESWLRNEFRDEIRAILDRPENHPERILPEGRSRTTHQRQRRARYLFERDFFAGDLGIVASDVSGRRHGNAEPGCPSIVRKLSQFRVPIVSMHVPTTPQVGSRRTALNTAAGTLWYVPGSFKLVRVLGPRYSLRCVLFHDVSDTESSFTRGLGGTITRKNFEAALRFLTKHYTPVSLQEVLSSFDGRPLPPRPVLVTFDDAYASVSEFAAPLCSKYGVPAIFFVNAACLDNRQLALDNLVCYAFNVFGLNTINAAIRAVKGCENLAVHSLAEVFARFFPRFRYQPG